MLEIEIWGAIKIKMATKVKRLNKITYEEAVNGQRLTPGPLECRECLERNKHVQVTKKKQQEKEHRSL